MGDQLTIDSFITTVTSLPYAEEQVTGHIPNKQAAIYGGFCEAIYTLIQYTVSLLQSSVVSSAMKKIAPTLTEELYRVWFNVVYIHVQREPLFQ